MISTRDLVISELKRLNISFDETATIKELRALLPDNDGVKDETSDEEEVDPTAPQDVGDGITVIKPRVLRQELPLIVTLPETASKAQIAYAKILNAYAYQSPEKWETKKEALIATLKGLKNAPDLVEQSNFSITQKNIL